MSKKILLINPVKRMHPPFGLLYVASSLEKAGYNAEIFEILSHDKLSFEKHLVKLHRKISLTSPPFIGITCMSAQAPRVKFLTKWIKEHFTEIKVVLGGVHPTFMPYQAMDWGADFIVAGEGEKTAVDLANFITNKKTSIDDIKGIYYKKGDKIISTDPQGFIDNLDEIAEPAYHLIPKTRFTRKKGEIRGMWLRCAWLWTSRGCPSRCTFCAGHVFFGKKIRFRSLDNIFRELEFLVREFRIEAFSIADDTFTIKKEHVLEFCKRLRTLYPEIKWNCQARVNFFDEDMAKAMKDSGCVQMDFGVESGSQRILDLLKKGIKVEQTKKAFEICKKYGIKTLASVMVGNPTETTEDVDKTRKLLKNIKPDFVYVTFTTPFPGTELYNLAKREGLINDQTLESEYRHQLVEPLRWAVVDKKEYEKIYNEFSKWNIIGTLSNPVFLFDMFKFSIFNPKTASTVLYRLLTGDKKDAFRLLIETYI